MIIPSCGILTYSKKSKNRGTYIFPTDIPDNHYRVINGSQIADYHHNVDLSDTIGLHNDNGPALIVPYNYTIQFYINNKMHNDYGPAFLISSRGNSIIHTGYKENSIVHAGYYINGIHIGDNLTEQGYNQKIKELVFK